MTPPPSPRGSPASKASLESLQGRSWPPGPVCPPRRALPPSLPVSPSPGCGSSAGFSPAPTASLGLDRQTARHRLSPQTGSGSVPTVSQALGPEGGKTTSWIVPHPVCSRPRPPGGAALRCGGRAHWAEGTTVPDGCGSPTAEGLACRGMWHLEQNRGRETSE